MSRCCGWVLGAWISVGTSGVIVIIEVEIDLLSLGSSLLYCSLVHKDLRTIGGCKNAMVAMHAQELLLGQLRSLTHVRENHNRLQPAEPHRPSATFTSPNSFSDYS